MFQTALLLVFAMGSTPELTPLPLPGGDAGIGFDDLLYSRELDRVVVPAGRSGRLVLIDPRSHTIETIEGFTAGAQFQGGHGQGTTSADAGSGLLFASDRDRKRVKIVDPKAKKIAGSARLGGGPDYVRWVEPNGEVWVTEPNRERIEFFKLDAKGGPHLARTGTISVGDGPESLVIDATRGRAYTHTWHDMTVAIDLKTHREVARWKNGCEGARGIALDEEKGLLFVGCAEGKAVALDLVHDGKRVGLVETGKGVDIIAFDPRLQHLYVPGGESATMAVVAVGKDGALRVVQTVPTAADAHCVAVDPLGNTYVCDPARGRLLLFSDKQGQ